MRAAARQTRFDVAIVGAGPAGAAAARLAAARGARVVLLEKQRLPRYKTCGGGVVARAARWADLPSGSLPRRALRTAELHLHDADLHFSVRREDTLLWTIMRADLDAALCDAAAQAGAEIRDECNVLALDDARGIVRLSTTHGALHADFVVGADGANGRVARIAGWEPSGEAIPALEAELPVTRDTLERFASAARFDFGTIPGGYAWVFPKQEHLSVGVLSTRRGAGGLRAVLNDYAARLDLPQPRSGATHGARIPWRVRRPCARGRVFLCGDTAGLVDPVTCEGISYALRSGGLCADALVESAGDAGRAGALYRARLAREILPELRAARALARVLYGPVALRNLLFRRLGPSLCEAMVDVITGEQTYRSLVASPKSYARLLRRVVRPRHAARAALL